MGASTLAGAARALALVTAVTAAGASAQQPLVPVPLDSGAIIRLRFSSAPPEIGRLVAPFGPDSSAFRYYDRFRLTEFHTRGGVFVTPAAGVAAVDVRVRTRSSEGAMFGGVVGLGFGLAGYKAFAGHCVDCQTMLGFGAASLAGVSALIGASIGGRSFVWRPARTWSPAIDRALSLDSGTIVRLELAHETRMTGRLLAWFPGDSAVFQYCTWPARRSCRSPDDPLAGRVAAADVRGIQVRERSRWSEGAVVGAMLGMIGGIEACRVFSENGSCMGAPLLLISAGFGGSVGGLAGSATGVWRAP